jgi:superfamily II DNA or RNA helicase
MDFALAYIDPGSGSLIIQFIIASIVAVPYFFRQQIGRVIRGIRGDRSATAAAAETATPEATAPRDDSAG